MIPTVKLFKKNQDSATIGFFFKNFIAALRKREHEHEHTGRTLEALDERTCIAHISFVINPVANLHRPIKSCKKVDKKVHVFTSQHKIDAVLEYSKLIVTIHSYAKAQSYIKAASAPSYQKDAWRTRICTAAAATTETTSEYYPGLKTNPNWTFTLDGKFYTLKSFVSEDIYLGRLPKSFCDVRR